MHASIQYFILWIQWVWTGYWKRTDEGSEIWPHQKRVKPRQKYHGRSAVKTSICGRETQLMWTQQCSLSLPLHNDYGCWLMAEGGKYECNRWDFKIQRQLFIKTDKTTGHLFTCWSVNVPQLFFVLWRCQVLALLFTCLAGAVVAGLHQQGLSLVDGGTLHPFLSAPLPRHRPIWAGKGKREKDKKQDRVNRSFRWLILKPRLLNFEAFYMMLKSSHLFFFFFLILGIKMKNCVDIIKFYLWVSVMQSASPVKRRPRNNR